MEATSTVSTSSDVSRADARDAIRQAAAAMPLTSSVGMTAGGKTVASFRPSRTRTPTPAPEAAVTHVQTQAPSSVPSPSLVQVPKKHPLPTAERVDSLLIQTVMRNLDRGKPREAALAQTRQWLLVEVIGKNEDLSDDDRAARRAQVEHLDVAAFWAVIDAKLAAKAEAPAASPSNRPKPRAEKPRASPALQKTRTPLSSAALLAALAGVDQMTAGAEPEVTVGRDMEIPDEKPVPVVVAKSRKTDHTSDPRGGSGTQKPRDLKKLPLTTPGHVEDIVALFTERNLSDGMSADRALSSACGRVFSIIEKDGSLSDGEVTALKERVRAKLPKRGPTHKPLTDKGRVEELLLRFAIQARDNGYDRPEAAGEATDRVMAIVHRDVADADLESVFDRVKNWLQTSFTQPLVEQGGASLEEIEEAVKFSQEIFTMSYNEYWEEEVKPTHRPHGPQGATRPQPAPAVPEARTDVPKASKPNLMTHEEQVKRAAEKKAERARRAEASAKASRELPQGLMEKPGDAKRHHREKLAAKSKKGGKKQAVAQA